MILTNEGEDYLLDRCEAYRADDDHVCPSCGIQFSVSEPAESFSGFTDDELRACRVDGRVYVHSKGDILGYPMGGYKATH